MEQALRVADESIDNGGGPFGAVIVDHNKNIIAKCGDNVTSTLDPTAHAEVCAIREACKALNSFKLEGCTIYSSCKPCVMCIAAIHWSKISAICYASSRIDAAMVNFGDAFIYEELTKDEKD
jgi:guanine deaminase